MLPKHEGEYPRPVPDVLLVSDSEAVREEIKASVLGPGVTVRELSRGDLVVPTVREKTPDLVILDLQIGKMGGMAVCMDLRLEEGAGRLPHVPVLMLLDRRADVFLARRSGAEGWIVKPVDPLRVSRAARRLLGGLTYEDRTYQPFTVDPERPAGALK